MAQLAQRRSENVSGDFYVDRTCIDCDTCRWMAPEVFRAVGEQSAVYHQPESEAERLKALQALLSCPTASIGTIEKPADIKVAQESLPILIAENVYHCGYHAESSYAATSYLILRSEGNVLVDSPRFAAPLVKRLEQLGGIRYLYLTHQDDVADHAKFHQHFGCDRILHRLEISASTRDVEIQLTELKPLQFAPDLLIIPVPGHSRGHTVLLHKQFLFTGDHLAGSEAHAHPIAFPNFCWFSWQEQIKSMRSLSRYSFEWILPGHGRRYHAAAADMAAAMQQCVTWMETMK
jgi:glyoxylase-like metal-dependent hydrolase (beta-lactamase superfamily II)/ferredoxin